MNVPGRSLTILMAILAALSALPAGAQVDVQASLSRETVEVGETVELTIAVTGALMGVDTPRIPPIDYLNVVSTASENNIRVGNGGMERTTLFIYGLRASREGTYTIPGLKVPVGDQVYTTRPLALQVVAAAQPSPRGSQPPPSTVPDLSVPGAESLPEAPIDEIAATTEVDNPTPWVGEQVTLTLTFMQAHAAHLMGNAEYQPPSTEGLVAEPLPDGPQQSTVIAGVPYEVATRRTALIAPAPGEYTIGPATITFRRSFMGGEETIQTEPIALKVRPLPARGRPESFSGAVGRLSLAMSLPTNEVRVGEAASLRLKVSGTGDLRQLEPPEVVVDGDARVYQSGEERQIAAQETGSGPKIGGTVTFDYLIMPRAAGSLTVMPIVLSYFDPSVERYQSAQTSPATITVLPGEAGQTVAEPTGDELRYIKETGLALRARQPVTSGAWFWALQCAPLLGVGWALRVRAERLRRERDPRYRRRTEAARVARSSLRAIHSMDEPSEVYLRADDALAEYIAAKTDTSAAAISPESARERLEEAGVSEELAAQARDMLRSLRAGAYAPGSAGAPGPKHAVDGVRALVDALEEALR